MIAKLPNSLNLLQSNVQNAYNIHKPIKFLGPLFLKSVKIHFQALFNENCQFSRQIEKSSTFPDSSQIQAYFKVCGNHD